jgi:hypothetical protein
MAKQYSAALQESMPWAYVKGIIEYLGEAEGSDLVEGLQEFRLIISLRTTDEPWANFFFKATFRHYRLAAPCTISVRSYGGAVL